MFRLAWIAAHALSLPSAAAAQTVVPDLVRTWKGTSESVILGTGNTHHSKGQAAELRS